MWLYGIVASFLAGAATGIGGIPILLTRGGVSRKLQDGMLGFAAGIMLAATFFSLILPAINIGGITISTIGIMSGAAFVELLNSIIPHEHFLKGHEGSEKIIRIHKKIWLFIAAITLHNFPEGMSVGVGFGTGNVSDGISLAVAIGLQNIPEGTAVAASLTSIGYSKGRSALIALLTGLVEPVGGIIGATFVTLMKSALPFFLSFAGGAMLYVISDEIIPETHSQGYEKIATFSLITGFIIMMILDNAFG